MRLFLAVYPSKEVRDTLRDSIRLYSKFKRNMKFIPLDQLHITLRFLGPDVAQKHAEILAEHLSEREPDGPITLQINQLQFGFKHQSFPKHLITTIEKNDRLIALGEEMKIRVSELGFRDMIRWKERYDDNYHITIGRIKKQVTKKAAKELKEYTKKQILTGPKEFTVRSYFLVESKVQNGAVQYNKLKEFPI